MTAGTRVRYFKFVPHRTIFRSRWQSLWKLRIHQERRWTGMKWRMTGYTSIVSSPIVSTVMLSGITCQATQKQQKPIYHTEILPFFLKFNKSRRHCLMRKSSSSEISQAVFHVKYPHHPIRSNGSNCKLHSASVADDTFLDIIEAVSSIEFEIDSKLGWSIRIVIKLDRRSVLNNVHRNLTEFTRIWMDLPEFA